MLSIFSSQVLYEPLIYQAWNITMTSLPILWYALFDWEYSKGNENGTSRLLISQHKDDVDEETVITEENKSQFEYVTLNIKDKIAVKVADPLGPRATGVGCAMWKSKSGETGRCAWNSKGQCFCPAPE